MSAQANTMTLSRQQTQKSKSLWQDAFYRLKKNPVAVATFSFIVFYLIIALLAKFGIIAQDFAAVDNEKAFAPASLHHWFGTDFFGRDILSRTLQATGTAISIGFFPSLIAVVIGVSLGAVAGYFGGWVDDVINWLYTTLDSIPYILLLSAFQIALGQGLTNLYIALGLTSWVQLCRLVRAEFLKQKEREYVEAARSLGASHSRRIFLHILPNVLHLVLIQFGLLFVSAIKIEVILSFLGLGVEVGTPSWGVMINDSRQEIQNGEWNNLLAATLFMFGLILAVNLFNDALRDALDPKLKNK